MFEKRAVIYKRRDRETWKKIKTALRESDFRGVRAGHYYQETVMAGGCGAKLDPRDFGPNGRIDRDIYWIKVLDGDGDRARAFLAERGLKAVVEDDILLDAALRKSRADKYYPQKL